MRTALLNSRQAITGGGAIGLFPRLIWRGCSNGHGRDGAWRFVVAGILSVLLLASGPNLLFAQGGAAQQIKPPVISAPTPPTPPAAPKVPPPAQTGAEKEKERERAPLSLPGLLFPQQPPAPPPDPYTSPEELTRFSQNAHAVWRKIQRAYPDFVADVEILRTAQGLQAWLKPLAGDKILLADERRRRDEDLWESATVADTLQNHQAAPYARGEGGRSPQVGLSPGRARSTALLKALYGQTPEQVRASCESVDFLGQKLIFSSRHGAAAALRRVVQRLEAHLAVHPEDRAWILPSAGTFAHRRVAGSEALSAHAFAVAIDLNPEKSPYWRWRPAPDVLQSARDNFPQGIVDAFEAEHFVWGGKWHAYDFMHFEYRPEIVD